MTIDTDFDLVGDTIILAKSGAEDYCTDNTAPRFDPDHCLNDPGRGWLEHSRDYAGTGDYNIARHGTNDWIVTAKIGDGTNIETPEPASLALLGGGLAGFIALRRRTRS